MALILLINPFYSIFAVSNSFFKNEYTYNVLWKYNPKTNHYVAKIA